MTPSGVIEAGPERISVRTSGQFASEKDLADVNLRLNDRFYRLADIADIRRGYVDPPHPRNSASMANPPSAWRIAMQTGGNIQDFGKALHQRIDELTADSAGGRRCAQRVRSAGRRGRRPSAASPVRCSKRWSSCWWSASSASAYARGWWWRARSRWCWRWCLSSWNTAASPCSGFRSAH